MAVIHQTTLSPSKLELLKVWLPAQSWYAGAGRHPELRRAGGFRLDDPGGEVGIEFTVVTDSQSGQPVAYLVPLSYRGAPLERADHALIGTAEHGVLGRRWVYDGAHDPVLVARLLAAMQGRAQPQAQSLSNTPDPDVLVRPLPGSAAIRSMIVTSGADCTYLALDTVAADPDERAGPRTLRLIRVLQPSQDPVGPEVSPGPEDHPGPADQPGPAEHPGVKGSVTGNWQLPDGTQLRGLFATIR
jgi:Maltokinase N-terminal cap domain